jgi:hypothetical protein
VEGFEVIGTDDHKVGEVVAAEGDLLIVEAGLLRKTRHAIPAEPAPERRARIREGESDAGVRGRTIIPPDSHDPL